jgi:hypothetical protein
MNTQQKAEVARKAFLDIAMDSDAETGRALLVAVSSCGDYSLARFYDIVQEAIAEQQRPRPMSEILGQVENIGSI